MRKYRALTLWEVLALLVLLFISAAVLFPVNSGLHEKPRQSSCLSNVKQIGLGMMQYAQDYDEQFPNSGFAAVNIRDKIAATIPLQVESPANLWTEQIYPYVKNNFVYTCPSDDSKQRIRTAPPVQTATEGYAASYALNRWTALGLKVKAIKNPTEFVLLAERNNAAQRPDESYLFAPWIWKRDAVEKTMTEDLALTRHRSDHAGSCVGFADGHAKWRSVGQMLNAGKGAEKSGAFHPEKMRKEARQQAESPKRKRINARNKDRPSL